MKNNALREKRTKMMRWEFLREEEFKGAIERSGGLCVERIP